MVANSNRRHLIGLLAIAFLLSGCAAGITGIGATTDTTSGDDQQAGTAGTVRMNIEMSEEDAAEVDQVYVVWDGIVLPQTCEGTQCEIELPTDDATDKVAAACFFGDGQFKGYLTNSLRNNALIFGTPEDGSLATFNVRSVAPDFSAMRIDAKGIAVDANVMKVYPTDESAFAQVTGADTQTIALYEDWDAQYLALCNQIQMDARDVYQVAAYTSFECDADVAANYLCASADDWRPEGFGYYFESTGVYTGGYVQVPGDITGIGTATLYPEGTHLVPDHINQFSMTEFLVGDLESEGGFSGIPPAGTYTLAFDGMDVKEYFLVPDARVNVSEIYFPLVEIRDDGVNYTQARLLWYYNGEILDEDDYSTLSRLMSRVHFSFFGGSEYVVQFPLFASSGWVDVTEVVPMVDVDSVFVATLNGMENGINFSLNLP